VARSLYTIRKPHLKQPSGNEKMTCPCRAGDQAFIDVTERAGGFLQAAVISALKGVGR
jgi:hypothetical protein